jgi:DNA helicase-2/ATP-dependent DNA helicase PcrA
MGIMELIVDLHIHSHYSRATSKETTLEGLYRWGKIKGIHIIGTGDFTHPNWVAELQEKLEPAEAGLYRLRKEFADKIDQTIPLSCRKTPIRFVLTVEISTIYSKLGKVRKLHNLVIMPGFDSVEKMNAKLERIGNLKADGRPILGLDSKELLRMTIETDPEGLFIPAHIWTPWFGLFGSKSGFDNIQEAYEELTPHVHAIETGLSSDPYMNWRIDELQHVTIISNSDAHSPPKLGREATIVDSDISYEGVLGAIRTNDKRLVGTIEFYPEEGKYHYDGHRSCNVRFSPKETKEHNGICPKCAKPLIVGVEYRVDQLANKSEHYRPAHPKVVEYIIPLPEILAQMKGLKSPDSKVVMEEYEKIIDKLGNEFDVMRKLSIDQIKDDGFAELAKTVEKVRKKEVTIEPGYDGVYGVIKLYANEDERKQDKRQMALDV